MLPVTVIAYSPGGALFKTVSEAPTNPDEVLHEETEKSKAMGVIVQLVSYGLNPLPEIPTEPPGGANTALGFIVMFAEGVPTWNVAPAKYPFESVTLTR